MQHTRMSNQITLALGLGLAIFVNAVWRADSRATQARRLRQTVKEKINTWDDEGGRIPEITPPNTDVSATPDTPESSMSPEFPSSMPAQEFPQENLTIPPGGIAISP